MKPTKYFDIYPPVFYPSVIIIILFIILALTGGELFETYVKIIHEFLCSNFGWLIILSVNFYLGFSLYCAFSRFGKIRIGGGDAKPDFNFFTWFSMLFTSGLGSGTLFFSVAEPISHFANPPLPVNGEVEAATQAMQLTLFHFGIHPWSIYLLTGTAIAFFTFNRGLPLTMSATFQPLLGAGIQRFWGNAIDVATVLANLFGVAFALGVAAQLLSNGLFHIFGLEDSTYLRLIIIAFVTLMATISVVSGLKKGLKLLSVFNLRFALVMLFVLLCLGPTVLILDSFIQNTGAYLQNMITLGTWTESYLPTSWQNDWTLFYWIWWMAWAPFVGVFIARISKGRTIKEMIIYGLLAPSFLMFIWLAIFGNTALYYEMQTSGIISNSVNDNPASGFFVMLSQLPFAQIVSIAFFVLATIFFITSSDSASLVNDILTSGGKQETPKGQRIFWGVTEGVVAAILISFGGFGVINGVVTLFGFIFMLVLLVMCWSLYQGLREEVD